MRATALQRKIDKDGIASDRCFNCVFGHQISQKIRARAGNRVNGQIRFWNRDCEQPNEVGIVPSLVKAHFQFEN
jgi:hypothetical protein